MNNIIRTVQAQPSNPSLVFPERKKKKKYIYIYIYIERERERERERAPKLVNLKMMATLCDSI
jgi:hypothetical protein